MTESAQAGPIESPDRIVSIDVLRGVAVLGILVMNIQSFSMPGAAYMNPTTYGDLTGVNYAVWFVGHLFADMKFMSIFSMLFGAGILIMTGRATATGRSAAGVHYRRLAWLLLFGLMHAHLLWYGDILYFYAMCGAVAFVFRKLPVWLLIVLGLVSISITSGVSGVFQWLMDTGRMPAEGALQWWDPPDEVIQGELDRYRGGWIGQLGHRIPTALMFETLIFVMFVAARTGGMMLIGMALYKMGVFSAARSRGFYVGLVAAAALVGIPLILYGIGQHEAHGWDVSYSFHRGVVFNYWGSVFVALGWVGAVMLACKSRPLAALTRPLAAVGQMALTNYLGQTIICTTIFYGHGFGLFGHLERWEQLMVVLAVWAFQIAISPIWLHYFRFGPAEWLWRSLTYLKLQPMMRGST